jgi:hypothetical protein
MEIQAITKGQASTTCLSSNKTLCYIKRNCETNCTNIKIQSDKYIKKIISNERKTQKELFLDEKGIPVEY